jgi:glutathione S-transferase
LYEIEIVRDRWSDKTQAPANLYTDRARSTAGKFDGWDSDWMKAKLPALRDHLRLHLAWLERLLEDGRAFLLGSAPSLADLSAYHPLWYARGNLGAEGATRTESAPA